MKFLIILTALAVSLPFSVHASSLGVLGAGITAKESASGLGYIMYSPTDLSSRLTLYPGQATNFVAVYHQAGAWYYYNNETAVSFTPVATDLLVASVDYTADTVNLLVDQEDTVVHGIHAGYQNGDLNIIANQYDGVTNPGEFTATGSFITLNLIPPTLVATPAGHSLQWTGAPGHAFFIQYSTDLIDWSFFPEIEHGEGIFDYGFTTSSDRFFLRLKYTGIPTDDPSNKDFDGDGLGSLYEVTHNLDPFKLDTDGNGTPDGNADRDDDGTYDGGEVSAARDPFVKDHPAVKLSVSVIGN